MDLRPQGPEIIRTWLFDTVVRARFEHGVLPWSDTTINGWVLDPDRKKMSKSKGNVVTPMPLVEEYGPDALRYWACNGRPAVDTAVDFGIMKIGRKLAIKILNASKFTLNIASEQPGRAADDLASVTDPLDRSMLATLADLVDDATTAFDAFDYARALERTERFFWSFCDDYVELVKGRAYGGVGDAEAALGRGRAAQRALDAAAPVRADHAVRDRRGVVVVRVGIGAPRGVARRARRCASTAATRSCSRSRPTCSPRCARRSRSRSGRCVTPVERVVVHDTAERLAALAPRRVRSARGGQDRASSRPRSAPELRVEVELAPPDDVVSVPDGFDGPGLARRARQPRDRRRRARADARAGRAHARAHRRAAAVPRLAAARVPGDPPHRHERQDHRRRAWSPSCSRRSGCSVGAYTSPHLERVNERMSINGEPIADDELDEQLRVVALVEREIGLDPSYFEVVTAAALRWFADVAVDVAVVEVGHGRHVGRDQRVDGRRRGRHQRERRPRRSTSAHTPRRSRRRRPASSRTGATLVLGETDPDLVPIFTGRGAARVLQRDVDFGVRANVPAFGGRMLELFTPGARYPDVFVPLHGAHQGDNAAIALAAAEAFVGAPLEPDAVVRRVRARAVAGPARGRRPASARAARRRAQRRRRGGVARRAWRRSSRPRPRTLVVGLLREKDPREMLHGARPRRRRAARVRAAAEPACARPGAHRRGRGRARLPGGPHRGGRHGRRGGVERAAARRRPTTVRSSITGSLYFVGAARSMLVDR